MERPGPHVTGDSDKNDPVEDSAGLHDPLSVAATAAMSMSMSIGPSGMSGAAMPLTAGMARGAENADGETDSVEPETVDEAPADELA